jgi:hypothetical protein
VGRGEVRFWYPCRTEDAHQDQYLDLGVTTFRFEAAKSYILTHGREIWSLILRKEHRLRVSEEDIWTEEG